MGNNKQTLHNLLGDKEADKLIDFVQNGVQAEVDTGENNALLPDVSFANRKVCLEKTKTCSYVDKEGKCDLAEGFCENRQT